MIEIVGFFMGLLIGSFLNVCILRLPKEESIVFPASHCVRCQKPIAWFDNIPLLSFLLLKGQCRHCKAKISWQYFIIELTTGVLFVLYYRFFGLTPQGVIFLAMTLALLVQSVIDARYKIIPDEITLPGMLLGLALSALFPSLHGQTLWWKSLGWSLAGLVAGGGFLYAVGTVAEWVLKKEAMGGGDVKLLAFMGSLIGIEGIFWTIFSSSILGAVCGLYLRWKTKEELIPFGPYLALGAVSYVWVGPQAIAWYRSVFLTVY